MSPTPQADDVYESTPRYQELRYEPAKSGDEVVISGVAGLFPDSDNVQQFTDNLFNKVDMVSDDDRRWKLDHPEIPQRTGKINDMNKFDAQYFGVHYKQASNMDPMCRLLMEAVYSAVVDAGLSPKALRNTRTGVFIGGCFSESERTVYYEKVQVNGFGITGCSRSMLSNRLSYWLGTTGPSYTIDDDCASSLVALEHGYKAIRNGDCDAAIIGGSHLCMHPYISMRFFRMGFLSKDGKTRVFDENADGYARSETIGVMLLQRASDAKRIYAEVVHAKSAVLGATKYHTEYRDAMYQRMFLEEFYREISLNPNQVEFVEAYGAGIPRMDREELEAIDQVFCKDRTKPLYVGSVKSNAGHAEAASGMLSLTKACIAYQKGKIAPNLHYEKACNVKVLKEGRIIIPTDVITFNKGYLAINGFGYTGMNAHALLRCMHKEKKYDQHRTHDLPYLIVASGRTQSAVHRVLDGAGIIQDNKGKQKCLDIEHISLLHSVYEYDILGHIYRGFNLISHDGEKITSLGKSVEHFPGVKRPVWFVYSGMGSQWSGMAAQLMRIPIFAAAIQRCHKALEPKGLNLTYLVTNTDPKIYDNILHSFVGIAAVQIGLTDILRELNIEPDHIIGHSVGELGCAYADGCFTAEQMILAAYSRGRASVETPFIKGSMAAVGVGYNEVKRLCPPEIEVACHNGPDSSTISGPADVMKEFVAKLTARGIFAKEVPCSNIAYHSRYIAEAGPVLLRYLREVIPTPRARSERWVSTSVPQSDWSQDSAKYSSAEYHTNNLLSSVLFEETSRLIPGNAIIIEIAPHGLLQAILRRSLKKDCTNIPLTKRGHPDNVQFLLNALGKLYEVGVNPKLENLYPKVEMPVTANTPYVSNLVEWEHTNDWFSCSYKPFSLVKSGERDIYMSLYDDDYKFMEGHIINGLNTFPAMGYLVIVWDTFGRMVGVPYTSLSVSFEEVNFEGDTVITMDKAYQLTVMIQKATGNFEIIHDGVTNIVNGRIKQTYTENVGLKELTRFTQTDNIDLTLNTNDVYRIMSLNGYTYSGLFESIKQYKPNTNSAEVYWEKNWTTFLDSLLQLSYIQECSDNLLKPRYIQNLSINIKRHKQTVDSLTGDDKPALNVAIYKDYTCMRSGGVELIGLRTNEFPVNTSTCELSLEKYVFVPHLANNLKTEAEVLAYKIQIVEQNKMQNKTINILELLHGTCTVRGSLSSGVKEALRSIPGVTYKMSYLKDSQGSLSNFSDVHGVDLFVGNNLLGRKELLNRIHAIQSDAGFILSKETFQPMPEIKIDQYHLIALTSLDVTYVLLKKKHKILPANYLKIEHDGSYSWLEEVQNAVTKGTKSVLVSDKESYCGIEGLIMNIRSETNNRDVNAVIITDQKAPGFSPEHETYKEQLDKDLAINVYSDGKWGGYYRLPTNINKINTVYTQLVSRELGDLNTLEWREGDPKHLNNSDGLVNVYYASVSYFDAQKASGRVNMSSVHQYDRTDTFGMEYCGRLANGSRVMGLIHNGALTSLLSPVTHLTWSVPTHWSMEDAVTVPQAYINAFYCLYYRAELFEPGMRILVHNGTGALGQAVINICLAKKCEVFTTVSSDEKKQFLLKNYPQIDVDHISSSLDNSFEDMVNAATNGEGCQIVISSLSGELRAASDRCVSYFGIQIDLNKTEAFDNAAFGMYCLLKHRTYTFASMTNLFNESELETRKKLHKLMSEGIESGYVKPLYRTTFKYNETYKAFKYISSRKHIGKVVIQMRDEEKSLKAPPKLQIYEAVPNCVCPPDKSNIVISYGSQYYIEVIDYLVKCGSRNILLHTDADINNNGYIKYRMRSWIEKGVEVRITKADLKNESNCKQLLSDAIKMAPIYGIYFLDSKTQSKRFLDALPDDYSQYYTDYVVPIAKFDALTKKMCPDLRVFVIFGELERGKGLQGRSVSNTNDAVIQNMCQIRKKSGLPATVIQWGPIALELKSHANYGDLAIGQAIRSVFNTTMVAVKSDEPVLSCHIPIEAKESETSQILDVIEDIVGDGLIRNAPDELTLSQVGAIDIGLAKDISSILSRQFNLFYTPQRLLRMTIDEVKSLKPGTNDYKASEPTRGVEVFFKRFDPEEIMATEPIIRMPTQISDAAETEDQFSYDDIYVWLIPGLEGNRFIFETVSQRLKTNAISFQLGFDNPDESVQETAVRLYKFMEGKMKRENGFNLFAYSHGVSIALEMGVILEADGFVGKIFCLDGGPEYFKQILNKYLGHLTEAELQNELIKHYWRLLKCETNTKLDTILTNDTNWNGKISKLLEIMKSPVNYSYQYKRGLINISYKRILQALNYNAEHMKPLKSEIIVLKANDLDNEVADDCDLSLYTQRPVKVYKVNATHGNATNDLQCSTIINDELNIDSMFYKMNNCKKYNINNLDVAALFY